MQKLIAVCALTLSSIAAAEPPALVCEPCVPEEKVVHRPIPGDAIAVLAFGFLTLGAGTAITTAHLFASSSGNRALDVLPVLGPLVLVGSNDSSFAWTSALVFAAWAQLTGILTLAITLDHLRHLPVEVAGGVTPGGGNVELKVHF
jgi:hypothetical protein